MRRRKFCTFSDVVASAPALSTGVLLLHPAHIVFSLAEVYIAIATHGEPWSNSAHLHQEGEIDRTEEGGKSKPGRRQTRSSGQQAMLLHLRIYVPILFGGQGKTDQSKFVQSVFQATIVSPDQRALQLLFKIRLGHRQVGEKKLQSWLRQRGKVATSSVVAGKVAGGGG